jgi:hypothetical protein
MEPHNSIPEFGEWVVEVIDGKRLWCVSIRHIDACLSSALKKEAAVWLFRAPLELSNTRKSADDVAPLGDEPRGDTRHAQAGKVDQVEVAADYRCLKT